MAALGSDPGIYSIVDNDPAEMRVWLPTFATFVGAPPPPRIGDEAARPLESDILYHGTQLRGARNDLAKPKLGLSPRALEWLAHASPVA